MLALYMLWLERLTMPACPSLDQSSIERVEDKEYYNQHR